MKNSTKISSGFLFAFACLLVLPLFGCSSAAASDSKKATLRIYNSDDYMGKDTVKEFKEAVKARDNVDLDVVYSTFSTNEEMLSRLETGSATYDLICTSDYVIQKMMTMKLLQPFANDAASRQALYGSTYEAWSEDTYMAYSSPFLQNQFNSIYAPIDGVKHPISEYSRGFMWGTLGITYNPAYYVARHSGSDGKSSVSEDDIKVQMDDWNSLWSTEYYQSFQIKDSMRDTYSVGIMNAYDSYFQKLLSLYQAGTLSEDDYHADVSLIFNCINYPADFTKLAKSLDPSFNGTYTNESIAGDVEKVLTALKANCYGLEVDSGKTDITTGTKSGIDLAWSGDAITSMDIGDGASDPVELYYSVPQTGGNIWFDGWVLPLKGQNSEYAQKFIDFISEPSIAAENMDYIGYTSFIAGDDILDLVRLWYDPRSYVMYAEDQENDDLYYDGEGAVHLKDGTGVKEIEVIDDEGKTSVHHIDFGEENFTGSDYLAPVVNGVAGTWDSYAEENEWDQNDLTYFFGGSFSEHTDSDAIFYTDEISVVTGKGLDGKEKTAVVGRQFMAQYPLASQLPGLSVMEAYGDNNEYVLRMWVNVKASGSLQTWIVVVIGVEVAIALGLGGFYLYRNVSSKRLRKKRRLERTGKSK